MSQARGRYSGSRDSGQRHPHHVKKSPANRQGQPYVKGSATRDPAQTASIFKTRSFQLLVDAVGAENIALGLDSSLTRVAELMKGERFTPETAFHMETTLGLPHGFFDQPNPVLTPEIIARLRSPLDVVQTDAEPEVVAEIYKVAPAPIVNQQSFRTDRLPEEPEMAKKATGGSPRAVQKRGNTAAVQPAARTPLKAVPAKAKSSPKSSEQQSLLLNDSAAVENIRRANLHVLTTRNGSKVRLGAVMAITGSRPIGYTARNVWTMPKLNVSRNAWVFQPAGWTLRARKQRSRNPCLACFFRFPAVRHPSRKNDRARVPMKAHLVRNVSRVRKKQLSSATKITQAIPGLSLPVPHLERATPRARQRSSSCRVLQPRRCIRCRAPSLL